MGMSGVYREIAAPERIVATEKFDEAWYPGEAVGTLVLSEQGGKTTVSQAVLYQSREARDAVLKSGMEKGVIAGYDRLAELLASPPAQGMEKGSGVMSEAAMIETRPPRRIGRSIGALLAGMLVGIVLTIGTDIVLHVTGVFPPWGQSMVGFDGALLLATAYRTVFGVVGSYIIARLAPSRPMQHALVGGVVGLVVSIVGAAVTWNKGPAFGPHWYPLALIVLAMPQAWVGGKLRMMQLRARLDG
jgi:hypothetical protein